MVRIYKVLATPLGGLVYISLTVYSIVRPFRDFTFEEKSVYLNFSEMNLRLSVLLSYYLTWNSTITYKEEWSISETNLVKLPETVDSLLHIESSGTKKR